MAKINNSPITTKPWYAKYVRYMFVSVSIIQVIGVIIIESIFIKSILDLEPKVFDPNSKSPQNTGENPTADKLTMLVYLVIFMSSQVFQAVFSFQAVRFRNSYQVIGLLVFNAMTLAYSIFQYFQLKKTVKSYESPAEKTPLMMLVILAAAFISTCEFSLLGLGIRLLKDFGWSIYRSIGCDIEMRKMLYAYQSFIVIVELEAFFFGGFMTQLLIFGSSKSFGFYIDLLVTPLIVIVPVLGVWGIRKEIKPALLIALGGYVFITIFSLVKIVEICSSEGYKDHHYFLTLFATLTALFGIGSFSLGLFCLLQFGRGLGSHLNNPVSRSSSSRTRRELDLGYD